MDIVRKSNYHFYFAKVEDFVGFSLTTAKAGEMVKVLTKFAVTSDQKSFYTYVEQIVKTFFAKIAISVNAVYQFIIIIHKDLSADIYVNDFAIIIEAIAKRKFDKGELLFQHDIADIRKLKLPDINILRTDKIIYCFKVGWKFGLFYDLDRSREDLDIERMELTIGELYRYLSFQYLYDTMESENDFEELLKDGWFPFIEIITTEEYKILIEAYRDKPNIEWRVNQFIEKFDVKRIETIMNRWWSKEIFEEKKDILNAGVSAYLSGTNHGYISSIKTILPEIEGIIRLQYYKDTSKGNKVGIRELLNYLLKKGRSKAGSNYSLFLPSPFFKYLSDHVFANFDIESGKVKLSRHSSGHGVAKPEDYTRIKAFQMILIIDQIFFYI